MQDASGCLHFLSRIYSLTSSFSFSQRKRNYIYKYLYNASARITKEYRMPAIERGYSRLILISVYSPLRCIENLL